MTQPEDRWEWIGTFETLNGTFNIFEPDPNDIHIEEIANALSNMCRYNGHVPHFYSVAEHSIKVAQNLLQTAPGNVSNRLLLTALLHDAAEAYIGDMIRPLKRHPQYGQAIRQADQTITNLILTKYKALKPIPPLIEEADRNVYYWERNNIKTGKTKGQTPTQARKHFLQTFRQYAG